MGLNRREQKKVPAKSKNAGTFFCSAAPHHADGDGSSTTMDSTAKITCAIRVAQVTPAMLKCLVNDKILQVFDRSGIELT